MTTDAATKVQVEDMENTELIAEIYSGLAQIPDLCRRIDDLHTDMTQRTDEIKGRQDTTNGRLRGVELAQARQEGGVHAMKWMLGIALALPTAIAAVGGIVGTIIVINGGG